MFLATLSTTALLSLSAGAGVPDPISELRAAERGRRVTALMHLAETGSRAVGVITPLIELLCAPDEECQLLAALALGGIGGTAVPALQKKLSDEDEMVRFHAAWALGLMGTEARDALPVLLRCLRDKEPEVRYKATFAVSRVGKGAPAVVHALLPLLRDSDEDVRAAAGQAFAGFGVKAIPALAPLVQAGSPPTGALQALSAILESKEEGTREAISPLLSDFCRLYRLPSEKFVHQWSYALDRLVEPFGVEAAPLLLQMLHERDGRYRYRACDLLAAIGKRLHDTGQEPKTVRQIAEALRDLLPDEDSVVRQHACWGLMRLDAAARFTLPQLYERLYFPKDELDCDRARSQIKRWEGTDPIEQMMKMLADAKGEERLKMAIAITRHEAHGPAVAVLRDSLEDRNHRHTAAYALVTARFWAGDDALAEQLAAIFREGLGAPDGSRRRDAAGGLASLRQRFWAQVPRDDRKMELEMLAAVTRLSRNAEAELLAALDSKDYETRRYALFALADLVNERPKTLLPIVLDKLKKTPARDYRVFQFLQGLGKPGVPPLVELLKGATADSACLHLGFMKKTASAAAPKLYELVQNEGVAADSRHYRLDALVAVAGDEYFDKLIAWQAKRDSAFKAALKGHEAREASAFLRGVLTALKTNDPDACYPAIECLIKVRPLLPEEAAATLTETWMPVWRELLPFLKQQARAENAQPRRQAVEAMIRLRRFGYEVYTLTDSCLEMSRDINAVLEDLRADSDLLVRRQVRRALIIQDQRWGVPLP